MKKSNLDNFKYLGLGIFLYALVAIPVAAAFKFNQFGIVILLWQAIIISAGLIVGWFMFKEPITSLKVVTLVMAIATIGLGYFASR